MESHLATLASTPAYLMILIRPERVPRKTVSTPGSTLDTHTTRTHAQVQVIPSATAQQCHTAKPLNRVTSGCLSFKQRYKHRVFTRYRKEVGWVEH